MKKLASGQASSRLLNLAKMLGKTTLGTTAASGGVGALGGGLHGAFRSLDPEESRLGSIGKGLLQGLGYGAATGLGGGLGLGALMPFKGGRAMLASLNRAPGLLLNKATRGKAFEPFINTMRKLNLKDPSASTKLIYGGAGASALGSILPDLAGAEWFRGGGTGDSDSRKFASAYNKGFALGMAKRAAAVKQAIELSGTDVPMAGMAGGAGLGALLGHMSTGRERMRADEYGSRRDIRDADRKTKLRMVLGSLLGTVAGGMLPGALKDWDKEKGVLSRLQGGLQTLGQGYGGYKKSLKNLISPVTDELAKGEAASKSVVEAPQVFAADEAIPPKSAPAAKPKAAPQAAAAAAGGSLVDKAKEWAKEKFGDGEKDDEGGDAGGDAGGDSELAAATAALNESTDALGGDEAPSPEEVARIEAELEAQNAASEAEAEALLNEGESSLSDLGIDLKAISPEEAKELLEDSNITDALSGDAYQELTSHAWGTE
jgi:hypothetical protein